MTAKEIRTILVDDHAVVRMGFILLLKGAGDIEVVAEGESGEDAIKLVSELTPDVTVMDISMPGIGGLEAIDRILSKSRNQRFSFYQRTRMRCMRAEF